MTDPRYLYLKASDALEGLREIKAPSDIEDAARKVADWLWDRVKEKYPEAVER